MLYYYYILYIIYIYKYMYIQVGSQDQVKTMCQSQAVTSTLAFEPIVEVGILVTLWETSAKAIWPVDPAREFMR